LFRVHINLFWIVIPGIYYIKMGSTWWKICTELFNKLLEKRRKKTERKKL